MKKRTIVGLVAIIFLAGSCIKTKNCNINIESEEKKWFPYDSTDQQIYRDQHNDLLTLKFSKIYSNADGEILEESRCQAEAFSYISMSENTGQWTPQGHYLILKQDLEDSTTISSQISFGGLKFFQDDYLSEDLRLSRNAHLMKILDTLTVNDSTYHDVYTIDPSDTTLFMHREFQNIWLTKDLKILKFKMQPDNSVFELVSPISENMNIRPRP